VEIVFFFSPQLFWWATTKIAHDDEEKR